MNLKSLALLCLLSLLGLSSPAEITLGGALNHNAVVQRNHSLPIWGTARDGEHITVEFAGQHVSTIAKGGRWLVHLSPLPAGGPFTLIVTAEHDTTTLTNILVGDVWLISGQSNMSMPVKECDDSEQSATNITHPNLRLGFIKKSWNGQPRTDFETNCNWQACTPDTARDFSAVGYFFANELLKDPALANVPIGLIDSSL
ncbi:MAG TPA: sialate O-acetylesterase, partial [Verrucomicrobiae bacterium]|nr:sialate O-acetylesterase [Verrucomicrobiae bacterium]